MIMMFYFSLKWDRLVSNLLVIEVHQGLISLLTFLLHAVDCPGNGPDSIIGIAVISEIMWLCNKALRQPQYEHQLSSTMYTYLRTYLHTRYKPAIHVKQLIICDAFSHKYKGRHKSELNPIQVSDNH